MLQSLQDTSAILPGGCYITVRPQTPAPNGKCCPPCNYTCPARQCSCLFPGTDILIQPRQAPPRPLGCEPCKVCFMVDECPESPIECTAFQIEQMIKHDSA